MECNKSSLGKAMGSILKDKSGHLQKIMDEVVDGSENFKAKGGEYTRKNFLANIQKH